MRVFTPLICEIIRIAPMCDKQKNLTEIAN